MNFRPGPLLHAVLATEGPRWVDIDLPQIEGSGDA